MYWVICMIGKVIKKMRKESNYSQDGLSKIVNIGRSTLSDYEREKTNISFEDLENIAKVCNYEILFHNKKTNKSWNTEDIKREDI